MDAGSIEGALIMKDMATQVIARVEASLASLQKTLTATGSAAQKTGDNIQSKLISSLSAGSKALSTAGMKLSMGLTLPLAGAAAAVTKFSMDFESNITKVETLSGVAGEAVASMREKLLGMGKDTATGPTELAKGLVVVTSTGMKGAEAMDVLKMAAQGSAIGLGETKEIARALTSIMNAYGKENISAAKAMNMLYKTAVEGGAEADELAGTLGRVVGIASQVGVSFDQVGAFIATFTRLGVDAAEATTSLRAVMSNVLAPTQEASKAFESVGRSAASFREEIKSKGLQQALSDLVADFHGNTTAIEAVFGNVRALSGVLGNTGKQAEAYGQIVKHIAADQDEFGGAVKRTSETAGWSWKALLAQAQSLAIQLGDNLKPAVKALLDTLSNMQPVLTGIVQAFTALPGPVKSVAALLTGIGIIVGPLLWMFGKLGSVIFGTIETYQKLGKAIRELMATETGTKLITGIRAIGTAAAESTVLVGLLNAALVAGLVAAVAVYVDEVLKTLDAIKQWRKDDENEMSVHNKAMITAGQIAGKSFKNYQDAQQYLTAYAIGLRGATLAEAGITKVTTQMADAYSKGLAKSTGQATVALDALSVTVGGLGPKMKAAGGAGTGMRSIAEQIKLAENALKGLTQAQKDDIEAGVKAKWATTDITAAMRANADGTRASANTVELYRAKLEEQKKASEAADSPIKTLTRDLASLGTAYEQYAEMQAGTGDTVGVAEQSTAAFQASAQALRDWVKEHATQLITASRDAEAFGVAQSDAFRAAAQAAKDLTAGENLVDLQKSQREWAAQGVRDTVEQAQQQASAVSQGVADQLAIYLDFYAKYADMNRSGTELAVAQMTREKTLVLASLRARFKDQNDLYKMAEARVLQYYDEMLKVAEGTADVLMKARVAGIPTKKEFDEGLRRDKIFLKEMVASTKFSAGEIRKLWESIYEREQTARRPWARDYNEMLSGLSDGFQKMAQIANGAFASFAKSMGVLISGMSQASNAGLDIHKTLAGMKAGAIGTAEGFGRIGAAAMSALGAIDAATRGTDKWMNAASGAMTGATAGAQAAGGWGALAGGLFGFIYGLTTAEDNAKRAASDMQKAVEDDIKAIFGSMTNFEQRMNVISSATTGIFKDMYAQVGIGQMDPEEFRRQYGILQKEWGDLIKRFEAAASSETIDISLKWNIDAYRQQGKTIEELEEIIKKFSATTVSGFAKLSDAFTAPLLNAEDLREKIKSLRDELASPDLTKARKIKIEAELGKLEKQQTMYAPFVETLTKVRDLKSELKSLQDQTAKGLLSPAQMADAQTRIAAINGELAKLAPQTATAQADFDRMGRLAVAAFGQAIDAGSSFLDALDQIGPSLDNLETASEQFGFTATGAFASLLKMRDWAAQFPETAAAVDGLSQMLAGLGNSGLLTQDIFNDLGAEAMKTFGDMQAQGLTAEAALQLMGPALQQIWVASKFGGMVVDETTAALLAQAEAAGVVGEKQMSAADRTALSMEKVVTILAAMAEGFGIAVPAAAQTMADKVNTELGKLPTQITIPVDFPVSTIEVPNVPAPNGGDYTTSTPTMAAGGIVTRPTHALIGEAGSEAVIPLDRLAAVLEGERGGGSAPVEQTILIELDGVTIARATAKELPAFLKLHGM